MAYLLGSPGPLTRFLQLKVWMTVSTSRNSFVSSAVPEVTEGTGPASVSPVASVLTALSRPVLPHAPCIISRLWTP